MDKLLVLPNSGGQGQTASSNIVISNDGATILSKMNVLHPAAKMLVELSQAQDTNAGDGTTSVVILAGALLEAAATLLSRGSSGSSNSSNTGNFLHPTRIATSFLKASRIACQILRRREGAGGICMPIDLRDKTSLLHAVTTCLSSKVVSQHSDVLAPIAVDSVLALLSADQMESSSSASKPSLNVDLRDIRIVSQVGGTVDDTELILNGIVLNKGSGAAKSAGGPTSVPNAKIALIQYCLSAPKTDIDNHVVVSDYTAMDRILREERKYILDQCKIIKKSGCNVLLIQKSILRDAYNELSLHFLAKMNIMVLTDIERTDVPYLCQHLGCTPVAQSHQMHADHLGSAQLVTDVWMEGSHSKVTKFLGIQNGSKQPATGSTVTILLRGTNDVVIEEAKRSLHDAQCVVRSLIRERALIAGGGAPEMEIAVQLRKQMISAASPPADARDSNKAGVQGEAELEHINTSDGQEMYCMNAFADAMEVIPYTLAENAGLKPIEIVTTLREEHLTGNVGAGINVVPKKNNSSSSSSASAVSNMYEANIVQPLLVSTSAITLATETVAMILKIDDLIVVA
jgi:T-complex protein 1 subunit delta